MSRKKKEMTERKKLGNIRLAVVIAIVAVSGLIAYSNTFTVPFHWDDLSQIVRNEHVHDLSSFSSASTWVDVNLRPLTRFSFALSWAMGGEAVSGYHVVNLMLHIMTALLVYLLTSFTIGLLARDERFDQRMRQPAAMFLSLLFLLHPLQTMAVTYIIQRATVMAALFYIAAIYLYAMGRVAYIGGKHRRKGLILIGISIFSGSLGILAKQNAITFPAAFLLYEFFFIRRPDGKLCRKYLVSAAGIMLAIFLVVFFGGYLPSETDRFTRSEYFATQLGILHKYILLLIAPVSQSADYFIVTEPPLIGTYEIIGMLLVGGLLGLGVYLLRKNLLISFGIFFFFLSMSIESGLIPIRDIMMEHRMYLPMLGFVFVLAGLILRYVPYKSLSSFYLIGGMILVILTVATFNRNKVWQSDISLWRDCLDKNPTSVRAMNNLGFAIKNNAINMRDASARTRELNQAVNYFTQAMAGDTIFSDAYLNRAHAYIELGRYNKALSDIDHIANQRPRERYLKYYLEGVIFARKGEMPRALESLNEAIRLKQDEALLYTWRGLVFEALKNPQKAIADFTHSLDLDPSQTILMINISNAHHAMGEYAQALYWARKAKDAGELVDPKYIIDLEAMINL